jgi:hypothetical protein
MATENVRRVIAMKNRQCLNNMADYFCEEEKTGSEYCDCKCGRGSETSSTTMLWLETLIKENMF